MNLDEGMSVKAVRLDVAVGDKVVRWVAGKIPMPLKVTKIEDGLISCGSWTFDQKTGAEVDDDIGWGPEGTGSFLRLPE